MANQLKHGESPERLKARAALLSVLYAVAETIPNLHYSVASVCQLVPCDAKTLFNARKKREAMLARHETPDSLELESIDFVPKKVPVYLAIRLKEYFDRLARASGFDPLKSQTKTGFPNFATQAILGFQSWLDTATATDQWPFAMQADGRPMDLIAATLSERVTEDIRWLTIREFGELAAHEAGREFHLEEQAALISELNPKNRSKKPASKSVKTLLKSTL
jgi:hypothetical protein